MVELPKDVIWFHAVNSFVACDAMAQQLKSGSLTSLPVVAVAIEIDVHAIVTTGSPAHYECVARHDPEPLPSPKDECLLKHLLEKIASNLSTLIQQRRILVHVIKFDIKTPRALVALHDLQRDVQGDIVKQYTPFLKDLPGGSQGRLWMNADVLPGNFSSSSSSSNVMYTSPRRLEDSDFTNRFLEWDRGEMISWLSRFGYQEKWGLSLGWTTSPDPTCLPYGVEQARLMLELITDLGFGPLPCLTFPVRFSLVFALHGGDVQHSNDDDDDCNAIESMHRLVTAVLARGFARTAFLTFWRGRSETLSTKDVSLAHRVFPGCTVDTS